MKKTLKHQRKELVKKIQRIVRPHLRAAETLPAVSPKVESKQIWVPLDCAGLPTGQTFKVEGAVKARALRGFTKKCILLRDKTGSIAASPLKDLPLEDLYKVVAWAETRFFPVIRFQEL